MAESLRILALLLHKNWLTRKRQWLSSLIAEILLPVGIIAFTWALRGLSAKAPKHILAESHYRMQSLTELIDQLYYERNNSINVFYAPDNTFTKELMAKLSDCFMNKSSRYTLLYSSSKRIGQMIKFLNFRHQRIRYGKSIHRLLLQEYSVDKRRGSDIR